MAPRTLVSKIDFLVIVASPKASCRSVADFAWEVSQRLNTCVEHTRYREASLALRPQAQIDTFADVVEELDRRDFGCIAKVHFKPQRARYRWRSFARIFDADDLLPLRLFVNTLFGTNQEMPFRVATNRPAAARDTLAAKGHPEAADGLAPTHASFSTPSLEAAARRIYRVDFDFRQRSLETGRMEDSRFETLTRI